MTPAQFGSAMTFLAVFGTIVNLGLFWVEKAKQ
jgi:hypothetical protein